MNTSPYSADTLKVTIEKLAEFIGVELEYRKGNQYVCHRVSNVDGNVRVELTGNTKRELINAIHAFREGIWAAADIAKRDNKGSK